MHTFMIDTALQKAVKVCQIEPACAGQLAVGTSETPSCMDLAHIMQLTKLALLHHH